MQQVTLKQHKLPYEINEEFKLLRTNLQFCGADKRVIFVTSALQDEGKSTTVLNLCRSFTEIGKKILLIDADMRRSVLGKLVIGAKAKYGLSRYLAGLCELSDIFYETETPGLNIVFSGAVPPNPAELLAGTRMEDLVQFAREQYDYVFLDCPPLGMVVDAAIVAPQCDGAILVISAGKIAYRLEQETVLALKKTECPILGAVLNMVDRRKGSKYYGKYYGRYYGKQYEGYYG